MTDAGRRPVTAHDLTRLRGVSDPQISPDGRRVAFVMTTASEERDETKTCAVKFLVASSGGRRPAVFKARRRQPNDVCGPTAASGAAGARRSIACCLVEAPAPRQADFSIEAIQPAAPGLGGAVAARPVDCSRSNTSRTAIDPSPIAVAVRLTEPA